MMLSRPRSKPNATHRSPRRRQKKERRTFRYAINTDFAKGAPVFYFTVCIFALLMSLGSGVAAGTTDLKTCIAELSDHHLPYAARFELVINGVREHELELIASKWGLDRDAAAQTRLRLVEKLNERRFALESSKPSEAWLDRMIGAGNAAMNDGVAGQTRPGLFRDLVWSRIFAVEPTTKAELARRYGFSSAYVRQLELRLQRVITQKLRSDLRKLSARDPVYDALIPMSLPELAKWTLKPANDRKDVVVLPAARGDWLRERISRAALATGSDASPETYAREERFNTFILALQLAVARVVNRLPLEQRAWIFDAVKVEILSEDFDPSKVVNWWQPRGLTYSEARALRWRVQASILDETLVVLKTLDDP